MRMKAILAELGAQVVAPAATWAPSSAKERWSEPLCLLAQPVEVLVVGLQLGVAVTVGLAVLAPCLLLVAPEPLDGHHDGQDQRGRLAEPPGDLSRPVLVGQRIGPPRQVDLAAEVGRQQGLTAGE